MLDLMWTMLRCIYSPIRYELLRGCKPVSKTEDRQLTASNLDIIAKRESQSSFVCDAGSDLRVLYGGMFLLKVGRDLQSIGMTNM